MRSAYVHVPFCRHRCGYCNFTVAAGHDELIPAFLDALERELGWLETPRPVATLFLGGGTPTHLPLPQLQRLLEVVTRWFVLAAGGEFSVEANPNDVQAPRMRLLADAGVNRLSLGVQSFDAGKLQVLERDHRAADICRAIDIARPHVERLAVDLIFAVPGETRSVWLQDLARVGELGVPHVSTYGLTYERGARFWSLRQRGRLQPIAEEDERELYETAIDQLTARGLEHYEVSNFARSGHRCRHNEVYWTGGEYYAAGPGAARHLDGRREVNHRSTRTYVRRVLAGQSPVAESECLAAEDRRANGWSSDCDAWRESTCGSSHSRPGSTRRNCWARHSPASSKGGLLTIEGQCLKLTREGLLVSDALWPDFLRA